MNHDEAGAVRLSRRVCFNKWMWWGDENIVSEQRRRLDLDLDLAMPKKTKKLTRGIEMSRRAPAWGESSPRFLSSPASTRKPTGLGGGGGGAA
jgi:hypothetical protein